MGDGVKQERIDGRRVSRTLAPMLKKRSLPSLMGLIPKPKQSVSLADMDQAVARGAEGENAGASGLPPLASDDIQEVAFFKRDELTTDLVCCEIAVSNKNGVETWFFHEEASGWGEVLKLVERLPGFDRD